MTGELRNFASKTNSVWETVCWTISESVDMLVDPLNNSINEKCSRIKSVFLSMMDQYSANFYIVSSHTKKHVNGSTKTWYERLKVITLPRELVVWGSE